MMQSLSYVNILSFIFPRSGSHIKDCKRMTIFIKVILLVLCIFILFALGSALFYLVRDKSNSDRIVRALTWRIALSFVLFILLFIAFGFGWITPHAIA